MPLYVGSHKIADTGTHGFYIGNRAVNALYNGSRKVYQYLPAQSTFQASNSFQTYVVPQGCTKLLVDVVGAKGHNGNATGGKGGRVQCTLTVTEGQTLYLFVAPQPSSATVAYNASDIRTNNAGITDTTSLQSRLVVAGGGGFGGTGSNSNGNGGAGGGTTGASGGGANGCYGGAGGTQSAGGTAGDGTAYVSYRGENGKFGLGGDNRAGGSGGSGWYGGGGGGAHSYAGTDNAGGGGGSSYTHPTLCTGVTHTQGYQNGNGWLTITPTK